MLKDIIRFFTPNVMFRNVVDIPFIPEDDHGALTGKVGR
jgi:hypothetical protein